jgi:hypothetical protein
MHGGGTWAAGNFWRCLRERSTSFGAISPNCAFPPARPTRKPRKPIPTPSEPIVEAETYAYSIAWILIAVATLTVGVIRRRVAIRHAAMVVLALSVAKVFLFDMASLDGVLRAASFLGLGVALIGSPSSIKG